MNINMLRDAEDDAGFWASAAASDILALWSGATLYRSLDGGVTYSSIAAMPNESVMGYANDAMPDFAGGNIPDELSSVNVTLIQGSLSSTDYAGLLAGTNMAIIGDEIVYFRNATLETNGSYTLRGFLRGRRGSEYSMGTHAARDRFVLVNFASLARVAQTTADIGVERYYKAVGTGTLLSATTAQTFTNDGVGLMPYAPVQLGGGRDASGNLTISWVRRNRISGEWRNSVEVPNSEANETYVVEVYTDGAFASVARTISGLTSPTTSYSAAEQTTDFGSPQATVYFMVYQLSAVVGRGHAATGSV